MDLKIVAAYLLAQLGGDATPNKYKIIKILESTGARFDEAAIDEFLSRLNEKDIETKVQKDIKELMGMFENLQNAFDAALSS